MPRFPQAVVPRSALWLGVALVWLVWLSRLIAIDSFPPFLDEMLHVHGSEQVYTESPLTNADLGRQFTIWWLAAFQAHAASPIWMGRVSTLLAGMLGLGAMMGLGKLMAGTWGMLLAALLYGLSAYHHFFARLALADPTSAAAVLLALYFAYRLSRRVALRDAVTTGILLFLAFGAKVSVLPFLGIPIAAAVSLWPRGRTWKQQLLWMSAALAAAIGLTAVFVLGLRLFGQDFLSNSLSYGLTQRGGQSFESFFSPGRVIANARGSLSLLAVYLGPAVLLLLVLAVFAQLVRRQFYLPLCLIGPLLVVWASPVQESRFLVAPLAILLLIGAVVLGSLIRHQPRVIQAVALAAVFVWGLGHWLPFAYTQAANPAALPLPQPDFVQYIYSDASGFGFAAARDELEKRQAQRVIGLLPNCQGFRYLSLDVFGVECPKLNPNGEDREKLYQMLVSAREPGVYAVLDAVPFVPESAPGQKLAVIQRPGGGPSLTLYDLAP